MKITQILLCLSLAIAIGHVMAIDDDNSRLRTDHVGSNGVQDAGWSTSNGSGTPDYDMQNANDVQSELLATAQAAGQDVTVNGANFSADAWNSDPEKAIDSSQWKITRSTANAIGHQLRGALGGIDGSAAAEDHPLLAAAVHTQSCAVYNKLWLLHNYWFVSKGVMWTDLADGEDMRIPKCEDPINCDFKENWHVFQDKQSHFFQGSVTQGSETTHLYNVSNVVKSNRLFLKSTCRGRVIRGTRRDTPVIGSSSSRVNWSLIFHGDVSNANTNEKVRVDHHSKGSLDLQNGFGTEKENAWIKKNNSKYTFDSTNWVEDSNGDNRIGQRAGGNCHCPNGKSYKVGLLFTGEVPVGAVQLATASAHSCVNGLIRDGAVPKQQDGPSEFLDRAVHCYASGWPVHRESIISECADAHSNKQEAEQCVIDTMKEYYLNRSTSTWHLEYKNWLAFKKFADKASGA